MTPGPGGSRVSKKFRERFEDGDPPLRQLEQNVAMDSPLAEVASTPDPARRRRRRRLIGAFALVAAAALIFVVVYFEPQTAFIDDSVSETLPGLGAVAATTQVDVTDSAATGVTAGATSDPAKPSSPGNSISGSLAAARSSGQPVVVASAGFVSAEHPTTGTALVVALPEGSLVIRFEGLDTSNGPDLRVVLSPEAATDSRNYADRLIVDELKGNIGDQNYVLDATVDLARYRSVVIWCERFSVAFGSAAIDVQA